jgi:hypothetical protein
MLNIIDEISRVDKSKINIKKPRCRKNCQVFDIYYDSKYFIIQSETLHVSNIYGSNMYLNGNNKFIAEINKIKAFMTNKIKKYHNLIIDQTDDNIKISSIKDITLYNVEKIEVNIDSLEIHDNVIALLYFKNIIIYNNDNIVINVKASQMLRNEPFYTKTCLIKHQIYNKHHQIQQPPPPQPPPPPPPYGSKSNKLIKTINYVTRPTLQDIIKSRKNLKKINLN